jgi:hypothetical protein
MGECAACGSAGLKRSRRTVPVTRIVTGLRAPGESCIELSQGLFLSALPSIAERFFIRGQPSNRKVSCDGLVFAVLEFRGR